MEIAGHVRTYTGNGKLFKSPIATANCMQESVSVFAVGRYGTCSYSGSINESETTYKAQMEGSFLAIVIIQGVQLTLLFGISVYRMGM
jgi:hypothetical protein